ncbi:MAG: hypothetical protein IT177_00080 [Acidobacteria bacterium]|nr:hypothetical protein [Acidobacteriota bacterium]
MRLAVIWTLAAFLSGVAPAKSRAEQTNTRGGAPSSPSGPTTADSKQARANPYSRLFRAPGQGRSPENRIRATPWNRAPIIKCGMTIIPGDPQVDPGIAMPPAKEPRQFTIRGVEPPICD